MRKFRQRDGDGAMARREEIVLVELARNRIHQADCVAAMRSMAPGSVDLVFADPPFNIGYAYDVYRDRKAPTEYLDWSRAWIEGVATVLKPTGTFWLAIGDDYAAELKLISQELGFHCRSWVIWYYTFGVHCKFKFTRSHTHLFHFVKDSAEFTFNAPAIAVPSARQLVYKDIRANPTGRIPDDTFILRPQDLTEGLQPEEDTWYFPRVAGTFKEREGFHGCQMPEQLLGRIIKVSSNPGDVVLDPFSGSATTAAVAKKLGRQYLAFDLSPEYIERGQKRLAAIEPGDPLDGAADPKTSAPSTPKKGQRGKLSVAEALPTTGEAAAPMQDEALISAYQAAADSSGASVDRVLLDPALNAAYLTECQRAGMTLPPLFLNRQLLRLRKAGKLAGVVNVQRTELAWEALDRYLFAAEIAWRTLSDRHQMSLDDLLCHPELAAAFDELAMRYAPGGTPLEYRSGALKLRKEAKTARSRAALLGAGAVKFQRVESFETWDGEAGLYSVSKTERAKTPLYVGTTLDLGNALTRQFAKPTPGWAALSDQLTIRIAPSRQLASMVLKPGDALPRWLLAHQYHVVERCRTPMNWLGAQVDTAAG